jgi:transposase
LLGDSPRTVQHWVRRFEDEGFAGLADTDRPGRPKKLSERQLIEINEALRGPPRNFGLNTNIWDSKTLSSIIKQQYNIDLGVRQFQQLIRRLGFRLRKQRPVIAKPDPDQQKMHKKT